MHLRITEAAGERGRHTAKVLRRGQAPYFLDTGPFPASGSTMFGPEVYYRPGRVLLATGNYWQKGRAPLRGNPWFYGGQLIATWLTTGETRSYNDAGNYFRPISPGMTVIQGGPGAWEVVLQYSYSNYNNGPVQGGYFWRVTPMVNWYLTEGLRLEFTYGIGTLNRFGIIGTTQFFQSRIQMTL